METLRLHLA